MVGFYLEEFENLGGGAEGLLDADVDFAELFDGGVEEKETAEQGDEGAESHVGVIDVNQGHHDAEGGNAFDEGADDAHGVAHHDADGHHFIARLDKTFLLERLPAERFHQADAREGLVEDDHQLGVGSLIEAADFANLGAKDDDGGQAER